MRYLRVGGRRQNFESKILFGCRKSPKMAQNPTRQVHALLGNATTLRLFFLFEINKFIESFEFEFGNITCGDIYGKIGDWSRNAN